MSTICAAVWGHGDIKAVLPLRAMPRSWIHSSAEAGSLVYGLGFPQKPRRSPRSMFLTTVRSKETTFAEILVCRQTVGDRDIDSICDSASTPLPKCKLEVTAWVESLQKNSWKVGMGCWSLVLYGWWLLAGTFLFCAGRGVMGPFGCGHGKTGRWVWLGCMMWAAQGINKSVWLKREMRLGGWLLRVNTWVDLCSPQHA